MIDIQTATEQYETACYEVIAAEPQYRTMDSFTKSVFGREYGKQEGGVKDKEMQAFASKEYTDHLKGVNEAQRLYIKARGEKDIAEKRWECARSQISLDKIKLEKGL